MPARKEDLKIKNTKQHVWKRTDEGGISFCVGVTLEGKFPKKEDKKKDK